MPHRNPELPPLPPDSSRRINVQVPGDLHRRLKLKASAEGTTVKAAVIAAIEEWTR
jgi:predicted HicB family RNase H-like nuclease